MLTTETIASKPTLPNLFLKLLVVLVLFAGNIATSNAQADIPIDKKDSLALVDLYNSTNGDGWTNNDGWLKVPVSKWFGITTKGNRVTEISLNVNNLTGAIPTSIGDLTGLTELALAHNDLSGTIPESIGNLTKLRAIKLFSDGLTGSIPYSIGKLTNLEGLWLGTNQLSGSIPASIGGLSSLTDLMLNNNKLEGTLPESLFTLNHLTNVNLSHNNFYDTLSASIGNMKSLGILQLSFNQFHGTIPPSIYNSPSLTFISLESNQVGGSIPSKNKKLIVQGLMNDSINSKRFDSQNSQKGFTGTPSRFYTRSRLQKVDDKTLMVSIHATSEKYIYKWFRDEQLVATTVGDSTYTPTQDGKYSASVINSEDTFVVHFTNYAYKKGDSIILDRDIPKNLIDKDANQSPSFTEKIDRANMVFNHPKSLGETYVKYNSQVKYDYALTGKDNVGKDIELRYIIQPMDTYLKMREDKSRVMIDPNNPLLYKGYLTTMAYNIAGKSVSARIKEFETASVQHDFNADWGGVVTIDPVGTFGEGFKHCIIIAVHKNNVGEAYYVYMINDTESLGAIIKKTLGSLKFK